MQDKQEVENRTSGMSYKAKVITIIVLVAVIVGVTLTGAWYLWKPELKVPDNKPAPSTVQSDGSLIIEKAPDPKHKPPHVIPKKGVVERDMSVTVKPDAPPDASGKCPPVTVNLSLVRNEDKTKRVVASSPDGAIIKSIDVPVEDAIPPPNPKLWAVGGVYSTKGEFGGFVDRDFGWSRLGLQINEVKENGIRSGWEAWAKVGIKF